MIRIPRIPISSGILGRSMLNGAAWTTGSFAYKYALRLISTIIVTRLLLPEAYGLLSLAMIFVTGLTMFSDIGIAPSVIQSKRGEEADFLRTAWTIKVARGVLLGVLGCAIAWPAAIIYDEPRLFLLICTLSVIPVMDGFVSIMQLVCERRINLKVINIIDMACSTCATVLTILFAWQLGSVWALVIGSMAGAGLKTILSFIFLPKFAHRIELNRKDAIEILTFGGWILLSTMAAFVAVPGLVLIQGALVSVTVLGFITLANTLAWAMGEFISVIMAKVLFPAMAEIARERPEELQPKVYKILSIVYYGLLPPFVLLALVAHPLIDLLYDDRYAVVGDFLAIMAINSALMVMVAPYSNVILAKGDARLHFILVAVTAILRVIPMVVGFYVANAFGMIVGIGLGVICYNIYIIYVADRERFGCLKRDYLMQALWSVILLFIALRVFNGDGYTELQAL